MHRPPTSTPSSRAPRRGLGAAAAAILAATVLAGGVARAATSDDGSPTPPPPAPVGAIASFEGGWLDLAVSWGEATACHASAAAVRCYRSEAEMDRAEGLSPAGFDGGIPAPQGLRAPESRLVLTCSTTLRLYRSANYAGGVLALDSRGVTINLPAYGFDDDTGSYKTGACSATFWEYVNGLGSTYPGLTVSNVSSPSMVAGWDNRVSSVYIS